LARGLRNESWSCSERPLGGEPAGTTWGACGRPSGPVEVDNTEMGRGSGDRITREAMGVATAGTHGVNRGCHSGSVMPAMASRRRRGQRGSSARVRARARESSRLRWSEGRKPSSLGARRPLSAHDNKSVAEVGERHHPCGANGTSVSRVTLGSDSPGPIPLTRRVRRRVVKLVLWPRDVWRIVVHLRPPPPARWSRAN